MNLLTRRDKLQSGSPGSGPPAQQETLRNSMDMVAADAALSIRKFLPHGVQGHLWLRSHCMGRYTWSPTYAPIDVGYLLGRL